MAQLYRATLDPAKAELLAAFVPTRPWSGGRGIDDVVGSYRFDDPAGEVGVEVLLARSGDRVLQVPLTYRPAPLTGGGHLLAEAEHSLLGRRWVYDGCTDPVFASTLAAAVLAGAPQPRMWVYQDLDDDAPTLREPTVRVAGSGAGPAPAISAVRADDDGPATVVSSPDVALVVRRVLDADLLVPPGSDTLTGTWAGRAEPVVLATGRRV